MGFIFRREDTGKSIKLDVKGKEHLFDLKGEIRKELGFSATEPVSFYHKQTEIDEATLVKELASNISIIVRKYEHGKGARDKRQKAATLNLEKVLQQPRDNFYKQKHPDFSKSDFNCEPVQADVNFFASHEIHDGTEFKDSNLDELEQQFNKKINSKGVKGRVFFSFFFL